LTSPQTPATAIVTRARTLADLLQGNVAPGDLARVGAIAVSGLTADSRTVQPGDVFFALPGARADGARFIADAASRGAVAVVTATGTAVTAAVPTLAAPDARRALALAAARFHAAQPACAVAVTGTSGKTSTAEFTRQIFAACGAPAASLGTLGLITSAGADYGSLTTPDPVSLHATLARLATDGITHLAFEASSHGLDQRRLDGVRLTAAAFTNLGRDHLDYHATIDAYLAAKLRLFTDLLAPGQPAVINADGARAADVIAAATTRGLRILTTGARGTSVRCDSATRTGARQRLQLSGDAGSAIVSLPLIGAYQVENALLACGLAIAAGIAPDRALAALEGLTGVPGRLELAGETAAGGIAIVDYAHKPEALEAALAAVRPFASGRVICVFGCGGDRDRGKRPIMGAIAARSADVVIITDDNPRSETPAAIRAQIRAAAPDALEIGDRAEAIRAGVAMLRAGDVLLVAGKGHETGQVVGDQTLPFSDRHELRAAMGLTA
jgi:UDP-N-acetylmuramoyl-L-alanyl-D-glutamate--2,6-diaminopimelate ligase